MTPKQRNIQHLIILDESGSMASIRDVTISGFNELVQSIQGNQEKFPEQRHYVSLVTFNGNGIRNLIVRQPAASLQPLDASRYCPDSMTPLFDAIGLSVGDLEKAVRDQEDTWCLVNILTDGLENASAEYSGKAVREMIERIGKGNWTFTYIGANHDVHGVADYLSIDNAMPFVSSQEGSARMWNKFRSSSEGFSSRMARQVISDEDLKKGFFGPDSDDEDKPGKPN